MEATNDNEGQAQCFVKALISSVVVPLQTGHLAMETLLSLTSKRAGDWFKEELRLLGGLDHIVDKGRWSVLPPRS